MRLTLLEKKLLHSVGKSVVDHHLIEDGDKIMVCISGGKDSYAMLHLLTRLQQRAKVRFELLAVHLDQGHPGFPVHTIENYLRSNGYACHIERVDTYSIVNEKLAPDQTPCSLCSRLRRGILYTTAKRLGCDKIALGHHRDDAIETLLLNLFYVGQIKAIPPKLRSDDGANVVIRPLIEVEEASLIALAEEQAFPVVPCTLCDRAPDLKRRHIKELLDSLQQENPILRYSLGAALQSVIPSHLHDTKLFDFAHLKASPAVASVAGAEAARCGDAGDDLI